MKIFKIKSVKYKLLVSYGIILVFVVLNFNILFFYFAKSFFYNKTVDVLQSIARDVISDDLANINFKDGEVRYLQHRYEYSIPNVYVQITQNEKVVLKSTEIKDFDLPIYKKGRDKQLEKYKFEKISDFPVIMYSTTLKNDKSIVIQIATTEEEASQTLEEILEAFLLGDPIFIAVILLLIYKMLHDVLRPMNDMVNIARDISVTDLDKRVSYVDREDEFSYLAKTLNEMIERLNTSFKQIKRFSSDASHQLKTPLTAMRVQSDVALKHDRSVSEYKSVLHSINGEIIHLQNMIDNLLLLTKMEDKIIKSNFKAVNLDVVLMNVVEDLIIIANRKGVILEVLDLQKTLVKGEETLLHVLCFNIVENAIKYTPRGKNVFVSLKDNKITIKDEGIGIEQKNIEAIFDRFYRVESSRINKIKGFGLGMSMVKIVADLHKAEIKIDSKIDVGTTIEIKF